MTHPTPQDDVKPIRDALANVPKISWGITGYCVIIHETEEDNAEGLINFAAIFNRVVGKRFARYVAACNPARIDRLIAHMDAQALLLADAERDKGPWRLLLDGEPIQRADEGLQDDCPTWLPVVGWEVGMKYNPSILVPMRRRAAIASEAGK